MKLYNFTFDKVDLSLLLREGMGNNNDDEVVGDEENDNNDTELQSKLKLAYLFGKCKRGREAERLYLNIIEKYPSDFRAFFNLAQHYYYNNERGKSLVYFEQAVGLNNSNVTIYECLSSIHIQLGNSSKAIRFALKGIKLGLSDANTTILTSSICWFNLNVALRKVGAINYAISLSFLAMETILKEANPDGSSIIEAMTSIKGHIGEYDTQDVKIPTDLLKCTILCVKWGVKYRSEYVNNLYKACKKYIGSKRQSLRFICFTDNPTGVDEGVEVAMLPSITDDLRGWWLKLYLFSEDARKLAKLTGWLLYIDLDTIICNSVIFFKEIIINAGKNFANSYKNNFYTLSVKNLKSEGRPLGINSSIMMWHAGYHQYMFDIWLTYCGTIRKVIYKLDHYLEMVLSEKDFESNDDTASILEYFELLNESFGKASDGLYTDYGPKEWKTKKHCLFLQEFSNYDLENRIIDYLSLLNDSNQETEKEIYMENLKSCCIIIFPLKPKPHELSSNVLSKFWSGDLG